MALFISYSSQDRATVDALTVALQRGQHHVWFDQELAGGERWWNKILEQIRTCEVFVVALSYNWLQSKPSQSELRYARALNRPVLPVRIGEVDSMRVNPVAALQIIDYRNPTVDAGIRLVTAVHALANKPVLLPDPLPEEPPVPFGYITRLGDALAETELGPQQQIQLLVQLRQGLDQDGDDPGVRSDIARLLRMLRLRHDVTYRTRSEIDNVLASIQAAETGSPAGASKAPDAKAQTPTPTPKTQLSTGPQLVCSPDPARPSSAAPVSRGEAKAGGSHQRLLIVGGAAVAVVAAIAIVVALVTQGGKSKPAPNAATGNSGPNSAVDSPTLESYLLGPADIATIVADPTMTAGDDINHLRTPKWSLSNPDCAGAYEPVAAAVYQGASGYSTVSGQFLKNAEADPRHRAVIESVAAFSSATDAGAFVRASTNKWQACAGKMVTETLNGKSANWRFAEVTGTVPGIAQQRTRAIDAQTCNHVLRAVSHVVIDALACGPDAGNGEAGASPSRYPARLAGNDRPAS